MPPEPVAAPETIAVPSPEPEPPRQPDGTPIAPCGPEVPGMACVPGAVFSRGLDTPHTCPETEIRHQPELHMPAARAWVDTFYMDVTEVTYQAYKACEAAGRCTRANPSYSDYDRPRQPMVGVSWFQAHDYCVAMGKRLPTEAEWELAARGPDGELHPWGDAPADCDKAVIQDDSGRSCGTPKQGGSADKGRTLEVGSRPAWRYGLHDMAGNAEEWVADWFQPYRDCGEACQGANPQGPCGGQPTCALTRRKVVKGGSWYWPASCATGYNRRHHVADNQPYHHFGFRCAAGLEQAMALAGRDSLSSPVEIDPEGT